MQYNFDEYINRYNTNSVKWDKYNNKKIIPLWIADSDFRSPSCIIDALKKRLQHGIFGYGNISTKLIDIFLKKLEKNYKWKVEPDWLIFLPGVVSGLNLCVKAFTKKNEGTISPSPIYLPFRQASIFNKRYQINLPLVLKKNRWLMDLKKFENNKKGKEKLLMLCNPQNPGGTVYKKKELQEQLLFAQNNNLIVCSDEVHCELLLEPNILHIPFASLNEDAAQRSITLMSPSKTFNIAGLGIAIAIIPNKYLRKRFKNFARGIIPNVNILAIIAATSAWQDGEIWLTQQLKYLRKNRDLLVSEINNTKILSMVSPEGTYLGWIDAHLLNFSNPAIWFEKIGIGLSPGINFGEKNFVRFNFACSKKILIKAINRIKNGLLRF